MKRSDDYDARWDKVGAPLAAQAVPADPPTESAVADQQAGDPRRALGLTLRRAALAALCLLAIALISVAVLLVAGFAGP